MNKKLLKYLYLNEKFNLSDANDTALGADELSRSIFLRRSLAGSTWRWFDHPGCLNLRKRNLLQPDVQSIAQYKTGEQQNGCSGQPDG